VREFVPVRVSVLALRLVGVQMLVKCMAWHACPSSVFALITCSHQSGFDTLRFDDYFVGIAMDHCVALSDRSFSRCR